MIKLFIDYKFIELGITYLLGIMLPGPSISLIIRNGLLNSRKASYQTSIGIMTGIAVQAGCILLCLNLVNEHQSFFKVLKIVCAAYLIFLGIQSIYQSHLSKKITINNDNISHNKINFFLEGFIVEVSNPFAFGFFVSVMTYIISPQSTWVIKGLYWLEIVGLGCAWFFTISALSSTQKIGIYTKKFNNTLQIAAGLLFVYFGVKIILN